MKSKKLGFILILAVVIFFGWILCIKKASGMEEKNEQKNLVGQADTYIQKQLYVRGIPLLEDALKINTSNNTEIQRKLLSAYRDYGDMDAYYELLQKMEKTQAATAEDYVVMVNYNLEQGDISSALQVAATGLKKHKDTALNDLYEKYRYGYSLNQTDIQEIWPTSDGTYMPAKTENGWNYIDIDGNECLTVKGKQITSFNSDGKAVIKKNGIFYVILQNGDLYGIDETQVDEVLGITDKYIIAKKNNLYGFYDYDFKLISQKHQYENITVNNCGVTAVEKNGKWGIISDSGEQIVDFIYEDVAINSLGQAFAGNCAMVKKDGAWILIDTKGTQISEETYADAKAPESGEYIAVANENERWGYINAKGKQVIDFSYFDAKSFSCGVAAVQTANEWGYISHKNVLVIEDRYEEAQPFHNGYALAKNTEGVCILRMDYYEMNE